MKYFDANAMIGAHFAPRQGKSFGADDLIEEMDLFGIDEALVFHGLAREYDFQVGNQELADSIAKAPRLHPSWVVGLHHTGSMPPPKDLVISAVANRVEAVRLFFGGPLSDSPFIDVFSYRELFAQLEEHRLPTFIEFEDKPKISAEQIKQFDEVLETFPDLPVILSAIAVGEVSARALYPRMERYGNLRVDISCLHTTYLIEDMVKKFGVERLIFGTHYPWFNAGQVKIALAYADISPKERQAIACENLKGLIKEIRK